MENESNKTSSQILLEAANLLEKEDKWAQGYFVKKNMNGNGCAMCAHGAIAYCGNKKVRTVINEGQFGILYKVFAIVQPVVTDASMTCMFNNEEYNVERLREKYGEVGIAHYKACKVGLSTSFNDFPTTTKQIVIQRLREAAQL